MQYFWALLLKQILSLELFGDSLFLNHYNTVRLRELNLLPLSLYVELHNILNLLALVESQQEVKDDRESHESCKINRKSSRDKCQISRN